MLGIIELILSFCNTGWSNADMNANLINYKGIDILKLFFAFCVVAIHVQFLSEYGLYNAFNTYLLSFAVPFFFVVSGFFFGRKFWNCETSEEIKSVCKIMAKKLFTLYIIWGSLYFCLNILQSIAIDNISLKQSVVTGLHSLIVSGSGGGLWYIQAILIIYAIIFGLCKKKRDVFIH